MKKFLFCSTVLGRKQYTVLIYRPETNLIEEFKYLLSHRKDAVIWPLFVKADIEECVLIDKSIPSLLKGITVGSAEFKMRYNGRIYQIDEITDTDVLPGYWNITTNEGRCLFDPDNIEFL